MLSAPSTPLSSRAVRQIPSTKRRGTAASDAPMRQAMADAQRAQAPMAVNPGAGLPTPSRRDNILAARADGTFDAKRDAYNKAGAATGHFMDEAGNITQTKPATPQPAAPVAASPSTGLPSIKRPPAPRPTGGKINGMPAAQAIAGVKAAQAQIPRQTAQNPGGQGGFQMPTVATALRPPVTPGVTPTSPVTPAAPAGGMMAAASRVTQGMQQAMTSPHPSAVVARIPALTTGPAAAARRAGPQSTRLNTGIPAIDAAGPGPVSAPMSPAEDLAESVRPGVVAEYRAFQQRSNPSLAINPIAAARADGGPVDNGKPYLMGEKGPELVVPKTRSGAPAPKGWTPPAQPTPKVDFAQIARRHNLNPDGTDALLPAIAQALRHPAGNPSKILKDRRSFIAGRRADGGPVDKGKPYLVGERGPEVVIPDQPGTVIPNHAINPNAYPGLSAMPPRPKATTAQPMVRQKVDGKNWKPSARPAAKAVAGNWRLPPPKIAPSLLVAR